METSTSGGYSVDQLLEWCKHDRLIESYDRSDEGVVICYNGSRREYSVPDAHAFLKTIFTSSHRGSSSEDPNLA